MISFGEVQKMRAQIMRAKPHSRMWGRINNSLEKRSEFNECVSHEWDLRHRQKHHHRRIFTFSLSLPSCVGQYGWRT